MLCRRADDVPDDGETRGYSDANLQGGAVRGFQSTYRRDDPKRNAYCALGCVFVSTGKAEVNEDSVTHVSRDVAFVAAYDACARVLEAAYNVADIFRIQRFGECRRPGEIAEHDCKIAPFRLGRVRDR